MDDEQEKVDQAGGKLNDKFEANESPNSDDPTADRKTAKFDWVTQRSQCSLPKFFRTLREEVEQDVKARNGLRPKNSPYEFSVTENGADFCVLLKLNDARTSVTFSLAEHAIQVLDDTGKLQFEVTLAFSDLGECKLYVNEEERQSWQVRRMALEELMFRGH